MQTLLYSLLILTITAIGITAGVGISLVISRTHDTKLKQKRMLEAEKQADKIVTQAIRKSRSMIVEAELASIKQLAHEKQTTKHLEIEYEKELNILLSNTYDRLVKTLENTESYYQKATTNTRDLLDKKFDQMLQTTQDTMNKTVSDFNQKLDTAFKQELLQAQTLNENHQQKLKTLSEDQFLIMFQELSKVILGKAMTEKDQITLIIKALEDAKKEGFF